MFARRAGDRERARSAKELRPIAYRLTGGRRYRAQWTLAGKVLRHARGVTRSRFAKVRTHSEFSKVIFFLLLMSASIGVKGNKLSRPYFGAASYCPSP